MCQNFSQIVGGIFCNLYNNTKLRKGGGGRRRSVTIAPTLNRGSRRKPYVSTQGDVHNIFVTDCNRV